MPLTGINVLEFKGLASAPLCGKLLADFGAKVTVIERVSQNELNCFNLGKRILVIDLKTLQGQNIARKLCKKQDVIIEAYRPGVMEKLNLGPQILCKDNPRLIYARLTGFGQTGCLAARAGHDINFLAISGVLSILNRLKGEIPIPPTNILSSFAGGSFVCAFGICLALLERQRSGCGQVIDSSMVEGTAYISSYQYMSPNMLTRWKQNLFYYNSYETKDGKYMSVAALEPVFFENLKKCLGLPKLLQFSLDAKEIESAKLAVTNAFRQKTQAEWCKIFENIDACVFPIVEWQDVMQHDHNKQRESFVKLPDNIISPKPAPRLSRTPGKLCTRPSNSKVAIEDIASVIADLELSPIELKQLINDKILILPSGVCKL